MINFLLTISVEQWELVKVLISAVVPVVLVVGVPIAILNLRTITRNQRLAALNRFSDELSATEDQRFFIYREFPRKDDYSDLDPVAYKKAEGVVNFLNKAGLLIEKNVLSARDVLGLTHSMIIRCWYLLEGFTKYHEGRIGGRYGRRVERLANRAKLFHDSRPNQRVNPIKLARDRNTSIVIYATKKKRALGGIFQRIEWFLRNLLNWY